MDLLLPDRLTIRPVLDLLQAEEGLDSFVWVGLAVRLPEMIDAPPFAIACSRPISIWDEVPTNGTEGLGCSFRSEFYGRVFPAPVALTSATGSGGGGRPERDG